MSLPARCDVAVLGGGLAGLLAADRLQRSGVSVVLLTGSSLPAPATDRSLGIVALGWLDSPWRLGQGLGERTARGLLTWSSLAVESLVTTSRDLGVHFSRVGSWRAALDEGEAREWRESAPLLRKWGLSDARVATPSELSAKGHGLLDAVFVPNDGLIDLPGLGAALARRFAQHGGVSIAADGALDDVGGSPVVRTAQGDLPCELAVVACGARAVTAHRFFRTCVYPVRLQGQRTASASRGRDASPVLARHRFEAWSERDGALEFVGTRWADQPEMGAGESDDTVCSELVSLRQDEFLERHLDVPVSQERERWTGVVAYTCDGLPLVGPLPGAPKVLSLVGWSGWGLSSMARAVDEVTAAMLGEPAPDGVSTPSWLAVRRLV